MRSALLSFACKVYRRPFRVPVRTSRGVWQAREGILIRLETPDGRAGFGEVAPIEGFRSETLAGAVAWCATIGTRVDAARLAPVPAELPCCAGAVAAALADAAPPSRTGGAARLDVAALLPAGAAAASELERLAEEGFRTFKLKIGAGGFAGESAHVARLAEGLPDGGRLRLDANGGLDARGAIRWLEAAAAWPVEFVEQPLPADAGRDLVALAGDHAVPIALDEAVRGADDVKRWRDAGWPGLFVVKPALAGDPAEWMPEVKGDPGRLVFSSALETAVGTVAGLRLALEAGTTRAVGYGVGAFFPEDGLGGPVTTATWSAEAIGAIDLEAVWRAL